MTDRIATAIAAETALKNAMRTDPTFVFFQTAQLRTAADKALQALSLSEKRIVADAVRGL